MPVEVLRPNFVEDADVLGVHREIFDVPSSATFVGDQNVLWRDDDPATYADLTSTRTVASFISTPTRNDRAAGLMDVLSVDSSRATLNSIRVELWATDITSDYPGGGNPFANMDLIDTTSWDDDLGFVYKWGALAFVDDFNPNPWDATYPADSWGFGFRDPATSDTRSSAEMLDFLASGNVSAVGAVGSSGFIDGSYTTTGRIGDFKLTVDYTLIRRKAPPCQISPRDDNLTVASAHIWPPPSSQQSGRPGGYY